MKPTPKDFHEEDGAALVELALILPILVILLLAMLDMGRAFHYWVDETHLANEAARMAAVDNNPGAGGGQTLQAYIRSQGTTAELRNGGPNVSVPLSVCVDFPAGTSNIGDPVRVTAQHTHRWRPALGLTVATTVITGRATMRLEAKPTKYSAGCT